MSVSVKDRAVELLEALGSTADQVAERLAAGGYLGERHSCGACPVAVYLQRSDLGVRAVAVGEDEGMLHLTETGDDGEYVDLPDAVSAFITRFDQGLYPRLVTA